MFARWLSIENKHRQLGFMLASLKDFSYKEGAEVEADIVLNDVTLSLYCLDDESQQAIFVQLPPDVDLASVPFIYMSQYEQAQRLLAVPYGLFVTLAKALPEPANLIAVYITGRSGSTLINHVFNELDDVMSLSEPDVITQFVHLRNLTNLQEVMIQELFKSTLRFVAKPTPFKNPSSVAIKFRAEGVQVMDLVSSIYPDVHNLFLYRNAVDWVRSFYRIFKRMGVPVFWKKTEAIEWLTASHGDQLPDLDTYLGHDEAIPIERSLAIFWLATVDQYLKQHAKGIPVLAVRYEDLNAHRHQVLEEIFTYCRLPVSGVQAGLRAFQRDSQEGTVLEQAKPGEEHIQLREDQVDEINAVLRHHPIIHRPDFIVPGTLTVQQVTSDEQPVG